MTTPLQLVGDDRAGELTVAEAAARYGVSSTTIRRRLKEKPTPDGRRRATALPNAHQDENGAWMIPVDDLETARFKAGAQLDTSEDDRIKPVEQPTASDSLRDELPQPGNGLPSPRPRPPKHVGNSSSAWLTRTRSSERSGKPSRPRTPPSPP
jgi:hypothetical protein